MPLRVLLRYIFGYVEAELAGGFSARFFSEAMRRGLDIFDVSPRRGGAECCVRAGDYKDAARLAKKCQCRLKIEKKHGLRFPLHGAKQKGPLAVGFAAFAAVLILLGGCVVTVDVRGSSLISKSALMQTLEKYGLACGVPQSAVRVDYIEQSVLLELQQLSWIAVNLSYGKATVEVRDKAAPPDSGVGARAVKIVAARDAQIKRISVESGEALVKAGDVVYAGQELVVPSGLTQAGSWTTAVKAEIVAYTEYEASFSVSRVYEYTEATGNAAAHRSLRLFGALLPLDWTKNPFALSSEQSYTVPCVLFGTQLPAALVTREYIELAARTEPLDESGAALLLKRRCEAYERETLDGKRVLNRETAFSATDGGWEYTIRYLCEEKIENYIQIE